ncbi:response regulator [Qipengyuania nanhaisediminis]|uniref:CheY chemotaxis protein or a CheY-like REC (Receiver) domain n=1 Tax=Qipengyuania nanhaisediminis TaxID=604088 RepID=A0A1I5NWG3_9SPHN|nr:response regulator [Qipengyuania nanhaisediminis]SFP26129.1 CheY chemotaxis protein or a CheY-like REC (receiver) domain [Qipengyuania nanhaisediminis]
MTGRFKILIVEDEAFICMDLVDLFEDAGFETLEAFHAEEAFKIMADSRDGIDLLLTDINLGQGPDGWDVARKSRELLGELPIIFVSEDSQCDWEKQYISKSVMFAKPVQGKDLLEAVNAAIK